MRSISVILFLVALLVGCANSTAYRPVPVYHTPTAELKLPFSSKSNKKTVQQNPYKSPNTTKRPAKAKSTKRTYQSGPCPCSTNQSCYGPRGGRYCFTSGGNKRYR